MQFKKEIVFLMNMFDTKKEQKRKEKKRKERLMKWQKNVSKYLNISKNTRKTTYPCSKHNGYSLTVESHFPAFCSVMSTRTV
jgi:hypothetical protein